MKRSLVVFTLMTMSSLAFADGFNYTYVQASYGTVDIDNTTLDGDGLALKGSFGITDSLNIVGGWQTADFDAAGDADILRLGLGVHSPITELMDVTGSVSYLEVDGLGASSDDGFELNVGMRANVTSMIEVNAGITYIDLSTGGDDTGFEGGALYNFTDVFSIGLTGEWIDDVSTYSLSARMYFGK